MPRNDSKNVWIWFILGAGAALLCVWLFWGVQVVTFGFRIHHYWLLVLVPLGLILIRIQKARALGFFLIGFGLAAGLSDLPDLLSALNII